MRPQVLPVVVAALLASSVAMAGENFRPVKVSEGDCQLTIINSDTGETFQPNLKPLTRRAGGNFLGTQYLQEWKNEYPNRQRLVNVQPFRSEQGNVIFSVHAEWEEKVNGGSQEIEKKVQLDYEQVGSSEFSVNTQELYQRRDAKSFSGIRDDRNQLKRDTIKRSDVKAGDSHVISYVSSTGLAINGTCKFSQETEGDESLPR